MKFMRLFLLAFIFVLGVQVNSAQKLPGGIKSYLDRNYKGWQLSPSREECSSDVNPGFVSSDFSGDGNRDYAVKFIRGQRGYIIAFVKMKSTFKPFVLHNYTAEEANTEALSIWKKGSVFENDNKKLRLKRDAPGDYFCDSDVGGIHYYQNGKFIGY